MSSENGVMCGDSSDQSSQKCTLSNDEAADLNALPRRKFSSSSTIFERNYEVNKNDTDCNSNDSETEPLDVDASKAQRSCSRSILVVACLCGLLFLASIIMMTYTYLFEEKIHQVGVAAYIKASRTETPSSISSTTPSMTPTTSFPSLRPTLFPSYLPSLIPSVIPSSSLVPSIYPSTGPTISTPLPTFVPTISTPLPTFVSTISTPLPTFVPTISTPLPTFVPTISTPLPTFVPTISTPLPTFVPTIVPSSFPTLPPTLTPTASTFPSSTPTKVDFFPETVTFLVVGDVPYNEEAIPIFSAQIDGIKRFDENISTRIKPDFLVHVGDLTRASVSKCRNEWYSRVANILRKSSIPVFITPGDNDYIDCPDPAEGLRRWRSHFEYFDRRHWNTHNLRVEYQANRPENVAFFLKGVLFITVHIIATPDGKLDENEWKMRHSDNIDWVEKQIRQENEHGYMKAIVIFGHAQPRGIHDDFFDPLRSLAEEFSSIPFTYIHGDGHNYQQTLFQSRTMLRVQVEEGSNEGPLFVQVEHLSETTIKFQRDSTTW